MDGAVALTIHSGIAYALSFRHAWHTHSLPPGRLTILNVSRPESPTLLGTLLDNGLTGAAGLAVQVRDDGRTLVFVAASEPGRLVVVDATSPPHMRVVGTSEELLGATDVILASGDVALVAAAGGVAAVDVRDSASPRLLSLIALSGAHALRIAERDGPSLLLHVVGGPAAPRFTVIRATLGGGGDGGAPSIAFSRLASLKDKRLQGSSSVLPLPGGPLSFAASPVADGGGTLALLNVSAATGYQAQIIKVRAWPLPFSSTSSLLKHLTIARLLRHDTNPPPSPCPP